MSQQHATLVRITNHKITTLLLTNHYHHHHQHYHHVHYHYHDHQTQRPPSNGWLFLTSGPAIEVAADGGTTRLGATQWATRIVDGGSLELSTMTTSDDGRERVAQRMENVAHEVRHRQAEVEALQAKQMALTTAMEEVA